MREPEWTADERDALLASRELDIRGSHGHLLAESTLAAADPSNPDGEYYYEAGPYPRVDWAERARLNAMDKFRASLRPDQSMNGYYFPVRRIERHTDI